MIVVADTSPLNYLILIDCGDLLPQLYGHIVVPFGVSEELKHDSAPAAVRAWLSRIPEWVEVRKIVSEPDAGLVHLGRGEREAIQMSQEIRADLLLLDRT